jgi:hypothetical protein
MGKEYTGKFIRVELNNVKGVMVSIISISCCDVLTTLQLPVGYRVKIPIGRKNQFKFRIVNKWDVFEI